MWILTSLMIGMLTSLSISVSPLVSFEPATIVVQIHIERDPANRWLLWRCEGENLSVSRALELAGEQSPAVFTDDKTLRGVPAGDYECTAELVRTSKTTSAKAAFSVR